LVLNKLGKYLFEDREQSPLLNNMVS